MSRNRKRDKPYFSRHVPASLSKRRRPHPPRHDGGDDDGGDVIEDKPIQKPAPPPALVVSGLPAECSVLDLKSRFEIYGSISRIRIVDRDGLAYVMYRAKDSAEAAIAASLDPSFGITIDSKKVLSLLSFLLFCFFFLCVWLLRKNGKLKEKFEIWLNLVKFFEI